MSEMTNQLRRRELDTMTDQNQAVAALAEAMFGKKAGPTYCYYAEQAINAIAANPDILREYGIGRLPETKDVIGCLTSYGMAIGSAIDAASSLAADGYARPDPQPEPTFDPMTAPMGEVLERLGEATIDYTDAREVFSFMHFERPGQALYVEDITDGDANAALRRLCAQMVATQAPRP